MLLFAYSKCDTCRKAKKWLDENDIEYTYHDIQTENPSYDLLKIINEKNGLPLKKLFNTSGRLYRSMGLKERLPLMDEEEQLRLLATDGMLVKRPILLGDEFALVGFRPEEWEIRIKQPSADEAD